MSARAPYLCRLALLCAVTFPAGAAAAEFLVGLEDVPLMPGLAAREAAQRFDAPAGRIVSVRVEGQVNAEQVQQFYAIALPELGWRQDGPNSFRRGQERLRLDFERRGDRLAVLFLLTPG